MKNKNDQTNEREGDCEIMVKAKVSRNDIKAARVFLTSAGSPLRTIQIYENIIRPEIENCVVCSKPIPVDEEEWNEFGEPIHKTCFDKVERREMIPVPEVLLDAVKMYMNRYPGVYGNVEEAVISLIRSGCRQSLNQAG